MNRASIMALLDTVLLRSWRIGADPIVASTALTADQLGHVVVDATAGAVAVTLPSAGAVLGGVEVTLRRKDVTTNVVSIVAAGADKIVLPGSADGIAATELLFPGDYLTLRADGAGKWWCVAQAQMPASVTSSIAKFQTAGVFTYTVPSVFRSGRRRARVTVTGGGGGGAHSETTTGPAGGGGAGGGRGTSVVDLAGVSQVTVTVGQGGQGGAAGSSVGGGGGGTSSFGTYISSTGGAGGSLPSGFATGTTTGDISYPVSPSGAGTTTNLGHGGGAGGPSQAFSINKGADAYGPGGGGAGGSGTSGTRGGGKGYQGEVLVEVA